MRRLRQGLRDRRKPGTEQRRLGVRSGHRGGVGCLGGSMIPWLFLDRWWNNLLCSSPNDRRQVWLDPRVQTGSDTRELAELIKIPQNA